MLRVRVSPFNRRCIQNREKLHRGSIPCVCSVSGVYVLLGTRHSVDTRERSHANTGLRRQEVGGDTVPPCLRFLQGDSADIIGGLCVSGLAAK